MKNQDTWSFYREYKGRLIGIIGGNILSNIPKGAFQGLLYFIILQLSLPIINNTGLDYSILWQIYWWYLGCFVAYMVLSMWSLRNSFYQAYSVSTDLRQALGEKLRRLSLGFFKSHDPGDVTSRMLHDVNKAESIISHSIPDIVSACTLPVLLGGFLLVMNSKLASILLLTVLAASVFFFIARKVISILGVKHIKAITEASSRILEYSRCIKLLKAYDMTGEGFKTLDDAMLNLKKSSFRTEVFAAIPVELFLFILDAGYFLMLLFAVKMCAAGEIIIPVLFSFMVLGHYFFAPVKQLGTLLVLLRFAAISTTRIGDVFESKELPYLEGQELPVQNNISFENVRFRYNDVDVLKKVSCRFPEKSMTALVGLSGSGKTTMTSLISRFWEVQDGKISIGNIPIKDLDPDKLLSRIAMVFQDVYLFNDTIAGNIRVGKPTATDEEVRKAAKSACCNDFIENLPDGYDTMVSEAGGSLSGGEKQRISIARAILKDSPIILLDEATASLDPENEADIQKALENLVQGKTLVVIAHRFKSIENADRILVVDKGNIAETGTHDSLVKAGGLYQGLWEKQQKAGGWKIKSEVPPTAKN